jgi:hypothetical protein
VSLRVSYDRSILRAQTAVAGTFMNQGSVAPTFVPRVDPDNGLVDLTFSRPANAASGAAGNGLLGSIQFMAMSPGSTRITVSGTVTGPGGTPVAVTFGTATVTVR